MEEHLELKFFNFPQSVDFIRTRASILHATLIPFRVWKALRFSCPNGAEQTIDSILIYREFDILLLPHYLCKVLTILRCYRGKKWNKKQALGFKEVHINQSWLLFCIMDLFFFLYHFIVDSSPVHSTTIDQSVFDREVNPKLKARMLEDYQSIHCWSYNFILLFQFS